MYSILSLRLVAHRGIQRSRNVFYYDEIWGLGGFFLCVSLREGFFVDIYGIIG